jgi:hypothetical protein
VLISWGKHLSCVSKDDRTFYHIILLFLFTGQFLERANMKGVNPKTEGGGTICWTFSRGCGQMYTEKIWKQGNAEYLALMPVNDRRKKDKEQNVLDDDDDIDDEAFPTGDLTQEQIVDDTWKDVKIYKIDMQKLVPLMTVHTQLTMKKVHNGLRLNKTLPSFCDSLP